MNYEGITKGQYPTHFGPRLSFCALALSLVLIGSGCATTGAGPDLGKNSVEALLKDADSELAAGQQEKAISVLSYAAKEHPTNAMPWMKMANIWFEKGNYPSAILAANEVLQRDAGNQEAKSLLVVAGLRVAAGAVTELRPTGSVNAATRVEAENLTNSLRGALGEKVLVPAGDGKSGNSASRTKPRSAAAPRPVTAPATAPASGVSTAINPIASTVKPAVPSTASPDPFKSLK